MADLLTPRGLTHRAPTRPITLPGETGTPIQVDALGLRLAEIAVAARGRTARARAMATCLAEGCGARVAMYHVDAKCRMRLLAASPSCANDRRLHALAEHAARAQRLVVDQPTATTATPTATTAASDAYSSSCALAIGDVVVALRGSTPAGALGAALARLAPVLRLALVQPARSAQRSSSRAQQPRTTTAHTTSEAPEEDERAEQRQRLLSLASHDLRTPLNTLNGFLEIVYDEMVGPLNAKQKEFLGYARSSIQQVTFLFENVLTLSRGTRTCALVPLPLGALLTEAVNSVAPMAEAAQVALVVERVCEGAAQPTILAEREALLHALRQVLANALLVSPVGGRVHIGTALVPAESATVSHAISCTITDAGIPPSDEDCAALLEKEPPREYTIEGTRGTGGYRLRLAIARLEVERLGGTLTLTPTKRGLRVAIALPTAQSKLPPL